MPSSGAIPSLKAKLPKSRALELRSLELSQEFAIENTPASDFWVCTTGISRNELSLIKCPQNIRMQRKLSPNTQILVTYRATFTEKYAQALNWHIPIVSSQFLYDLQGCHTRYKILPFSGSRFSTSAISSEIYANYFILLGAKYEQNCSIFIDFLICDDVSTEKYLFCKKYNIPIIPTANVFKNNYSDFIKKTRYDAVRVDVSGIFIGKTFLLDQSLSQPLFNKLRRLIIEEEGTRVSTLSEKVNFIFTADYSKYPDHQKLLFHYQYVFDCVESRSLLLPEFYQVHIPPKISILKDVIAVVDTAINDGTISHDMYRNKLIALGATVKNKIDMRATHFITRKARSQTAAHPQSTSKQRESYISVLPEWVDHCLATLKIPNAARFSVNGPMLALRRRAQTQRNGNIKVQFTGLPNFLKETAITKFQKHGIEYLDSPAYNECTHLIMGQPSISEKFLCTLVSGGWILRPDFIDHIDDCTLTGCENYEWVCTPEILEKDKKPVRSIRKWREQINQTGKRPFNRWVVKIYATKAKLRTYTMLIEAGGGKITQDDNHTHVFVDKDYGEEVKEIKVHSTDEIFAYLFKRGSE